MRRTEIWCERITNFLGSILITRSGRGWRRGRRGRGSFDRGNTSVEVIW